MKKSLFILLLSMCCMVTFAQESSTEYIYRPLSEFGTDTLRFFKTNFEHRSDYFKGKPLSEVLKYYKRDLPISVFYSNDTSPYIDPEGRSYINSFTISHYELTYYLAALKDKKQRFCLSMFISLRILVLTIVIFGGICPILRPMRKKQNMQANLSWITLKLFM